MSWDTPYKREGKYEEHDKVKEPLYRSAGKGFYYCIFRIGKKAKNLDAVKAFQHHMQREMEVPNAVKGIENQILIGSENVYDDVMKKIEGIKLRNNAVIMRELLLTASPDFFRGMSKQNLEHWVGLQMSWLKKEFGSNCVYAVLHLDETTPHIHAAIVPVFETAKGKILSNTRYFDGPWKLREWQDKYADANREVFKSLNRGIKYSKARHVEIKKFYGIINSVRSSENAETILKNDILVQGKLKSLQATLDAYRKALNDKDRDFEELQKTQQEIIKEVKELRKDREVYSNTLKQLSKSYGLSKDTVDKVIKYVSNQMNEKRER